MSTDDRGETTRRILQSWHDNAEAWTEVVREARIESRRLGTDAAVLQAVLERRPQRVLDAGCGEGWLARKLAEQGVDVTGFDASAPLVQHAADIGSARFLELGYEEFSARPEQVGSDYDVVVFNFSLFEENITPVLRAASRVLGPGGIVIVQTIHPFNDARNAAYEDGWRVESFESMPGEFRTAMPWYFRTIGSWIKCIRDAGLQVVEVREPANPETRQPLSLLIIALQSKSEGRSGG